MKKKLFMFFSIILFFLFLNYYSIQYLATKDGYISNKIRHNTPQVVKNSLKKINSEITEKIFIFKRYEEKKKENRQLKFRALKILDKVSLVDLKFDKEFIPDNTKLRV